MAQLYIVQTRPETVESRTNQIIERFKLSDKGAVLAEGRAIGHKIGQGTARLITGIEQMHEVESGDVLVTDMTDPDWEPIMKRPLRLLPIAVAAPAMPPLSQGN